MNRLMRIYLIIILGLTSMSVSMEAQNNYSCERAVNIDSPADYCSALGEFNNLEGANPTGELFYEPSDCWSASNEDLHDVWFKFTAVAKAVNILVNGSANGGTLNQPQVTLYIDNGCFNRNSNEIACERDVNNIGAINLFQGGLIIGGSYLIRIDGSNGAIGNFQLCLNNFNPPLEPGQDISSSSILCDKTTFTVQTVSGGGVDSDEARGTCLGGLPGDSENQSTWFSWTAANNGSLAFTISPLLEDDIDWVLFELPDGIENGDSRFPVRCSAAYGGSDPGIVSCGSLTGMRDSSIDFEEGGGCTDGQDGFVSSLDMVAGTSYALLVNNWDESGAGFEIEFTGTGEFLGPEPEFLPNVNLDILECDTEVTFMDASTFVNGSIVSWEWNFGRGASPQFAEGPDAKTVVYESIGDKVAALTVESDKGCLVTYTLPFTIQDCCDGFSDLDVELTPENLVCPNIPTGQIAAQGTGGNPEYQYSFDNIEYSLNPTFVDLAAGMYEVWVRDTKGCETSQNISVTQPEEVIVDAGEDQSTALGIPVEINASYTPPEVEVMSEWLPPDGVECLNADCLDISVIAPGTTTYTLVLTDSNGCTSEGQVTVTTIANYDVYEPNIIDLTSTTDEEDKFFKLFAGPSADVIEELIVFDRWGNRMYRGTNLSLESGVLDNKGWDGKFRGKLVDSGLYAWLARVRYVDNTTQTLSGDLTVLR